jgi:tetratricopeptide (TPR) repeat protein
VAPPAPRSARVAVERWVSRGVLFLGPLLFFTNRTENPYSVQIAWVQSGVGVLLGLKAFSYLKSHTVTFWRTPLDTPFLILGSAMAISTLASWWGHPDFFRAAIAVGGVRALGFATAVFGGAYFLSTQTTDPVDRRVAGRLVVGGVTLAAVYGLLQFAGWDPFWKDLKAFGHRPISTFGNPNFLSTAVVMVLPITVQKVLAQPSRWAAAGAGIVVLIQFAALLATMTRSSWLGATAGLLVFSFLHRPVLAKGGLRALILLVLGIGLVWLWPSITQGRGVSVLSHGSALWSGIRGASLYPSWHQRLLIWVASLDLWRDAPWWGKGWGAFDVFYPFAQARWLVWPTLAGLRTHANNAHQIFLEFAAQSGGIGLGLFLWILAVGGAWTWFHRRTFQRAERGAAAAGLAGFAGVLVDNALGNVSLFFTGPALLAFWTFGQSLSDLHRDPVVLPRTRTRMGGAGALAALSVFLTVVPWLRFSEEVEHFRGRRALEKGDSALALTAFQRAARWGSDVRFEFDRGNVLAQRSREAAQRGLPHETFERAKEAVAAFSRAQRLNPGYDEIALNRSAQWALLGDEGAAFQDRRFAWFINPTDKGTAFHLVGHPLFRELRITDKENILATAQRFFPFEPLFYRAWAAELEKAGRPTEAASAHERVLRLDLDDANAWDALRRLRPGGIPAPLREARELLRGLRLENPTDPRRRARALGLVLVLRGLLPDFPLPLLIHADLLLLDDKAEEAERLYRDFLSRVPAHDGARRNWNRALRALGRSPTTPLDADDPRW